MSTQIRKGLRDPQRAARIVAKAGRKKVLRSIMPQNGVRIMEEDWDNLILLDACRFDVFAEANQISGDLSRCKTLGTNTAQFLERNFDGREYHDTVYISSNSAVGSYRHFIDVYKLVGVWSEQDQEIGWDKNRNIVHPKWFVERAKEVHEAYPHKRQIFHFLQPHCPYIVKDGEVLNKGSKYRDLEGAARGEVSIEEMRSIYRENLEYVLDHVEDLIEELSGKTIVSADHGELFGDHVPLSYKVLDTRWKISERHLYEFGHWADIRVPGLTDVPWLKVSRENEERREIVEADRSERTEFDQEIIEEQLRVLGYRT